MTTKRQQEVALKVARHQFRDNGWYRAEHPGQRVTLASLFRAGVLRRRAHRGVEGQPDAAYEYKLAHDVIETFRKQVGPLPPRVPTPLQKLYVVPERTSVELTEADRIDVLAALHEEVEQLEGCDDPTASAEALRLRTLMGKFMPKGPRTADGVEVWPHYNHPGRRIDWVSCPPND